ncbi:MAG: hypothetical protein AAF705_14045 [Bacteroidota bacterium]
MRRPSPLEVFLIQVVIYLLLWLNDDYMATLVSGAFAGIFFFIWLLSRVVELIEPSKVPKWYYRYMLVSALAPILVSAFFFGVYGAPDWVLGN